MAPTELVAECVALPTLLTSRRRAGPLADVKPAPLAIAASPRAARPEQADEEYVPAVPGLQLRVRNTFIDTVDTFSPSAASGARQVATCPSKFVGVLRGAFDLMLLEELDTTDTEGELSWPGTGTSAGRAAAPTSQVPPMPAPRSTLCLAEAIEGPQQQHLPFCEMGLEPSPGLLSAWDMPWMPAGDIHCDIHCPPPTAVAAYPHSLQWPSACSTAPLVDYFPPAPVVEEEHIPPPPAGPALGSEGLPSMGSAGHATGECKPCAFFHSGRCGNDLNCQFCHLCDADERKRRRREKLEAKKAAWSTARH